MHTWLMCIIVHVTVYRLHENTLLKACTPRAHHSSSAILCFNFNLHYNKNIGDEMIPNINSDNPRVLTRLPKKKNLTLIPSTLSQNMVRSAKGTKPFFLYTRRHPAHHGIYFLSKGRSYRAIFSKIFLSFLPRKTGKAEKTGHIS